jgi:VIT1/CCC1 family predicted Fe2+/Mn2+ transporter
MKHKTDEITVDQAVVREIAGVVRTATSLDNVIDALLRAGFDRADIDVMADAKTIRDHFGQLFVPVEELADVPGVPRRAFVRAEDVSILQGGVFSILFYIGATAAALSVVASGGGLAAAIASAAAAGAASGGLGALAARFVGRKRAELIETMISEGGLILFVRVRSEEGERRAEQVMRDHGVEAVRVHEITIDKRLKDLPLADIIARHL